MTAVTALEVFLSHTMESAEIRVDSLLAMQVASPTLFRFLY
jgi:hypothetical protein